MKRANDGFPESVIPTLSAFANTPGGGTIIFGLDEADGFTAVGVPDPSSLKEKPANRARQALDPPATFETWDLAFEGASVVVAVVHEQPTHGKPCRVRASGKAYLRAYDGGYELSQVEEQAFIANRATPDFDKQPVTGATAEDLRPDLLAAYVISCRASSSALAAMSDDEILYRTGVTTGPERTPTLAGLLALGIYPQQHVPNCVIQASVAPTGSDPIGTRAGDAHRFDGPIPLMLDDALAWIRRSTRTRVRFGPDGRGRDEPEFPSEAVRELLSNALIHRDLGPHALTQAITLRLEPNRLVLSNPGGLWGITVDRLGKTGVSSARNPGLLRICQNVRTRDGARVVEALASGIPAVLSSLKNAGMVAPRFYDRGISFAVAVPNHALLGADDLDWLAGLTLASNLSDTQRHTLVAMRHGEVWTNQSYRDLFPMDSRDALRELSNLVDAGLAVTEGERRGRVYRLAPAFASAADRGDAEPALAASSAVVRPTPKDDDAPPNPQRVLEALGEGRVTARDVVARTGLTMRQVGYALDHLRSEGLVRLVGGKGVRTSHYELVDAQGSAKG